MSKFKIGDRVREDYSGDIGCIVRKHKDSEDAFWVAWETGYDAGKECWVYACEILPHIKEQNKTAEEIAPNLWSAYKDKLNDEALAALRELIEDVDSHKTIDFNDSYSVNESFTWGNTKKGEDFWADVQLGEYDNTEDVEVNGLTQEAASILGLTQKADTGSAADSIHYNSLDIQPTSSTTKSDGGSSDYYKIVVKTSHGPAEVEVNDLIYALVGGDFDLGNVIKASRRMYLASKGCGKEGVDVSYDKNKCLWFLEDFEMRFGGK